jgi:hypothetical protein
MVSQAGSFGSGMALTVEMSDKTKHDQLFLVWWLFNVFMGGFIVHYFLLK